MAKISPTSIKYMVYAKFKAEGTVEKPDIIGALFGQTEGLLGSDLDMRRLQKEGKIGRIEVEVEKKNSKTVGKIEIPSALDKTETTLVGAALETIEKIGPSVAEIEIEKIEDVRKSKRDYILKRAKKLLEKVEEKMPKSREMTSNLISESRTRKIKEYGEEKLPAGNIDEDEVIVVEGRADVLNLLRNGVENVIGMDGTRLPKAIEKLSKDKEITLFVDGDRGGKLIIKNVTDNADVNFVASAPDGKEVEELTGKEILSALRKKKPVKEFKKSEKKEDKEKVDISKKENKEKLRKKLDKIENSKSVLLLDDQLEVLSRVSTRGAFSKLKKLGKKTYCVIADKATKGIIKAAEKNNVENIVANNFAFPSEKVNLISL